MKKLLRISIGILLCGLVVLTGMWIWFVGVPAMASPVGRGPLSGPWQHRWQPAFEGVDYMRAEFRLPRPMIVHVARVDLTNPDIEFLITPPVGRSNSTLPSRRTTTFLKEYGCQIGINAGLFGPKVYTENSPVQALGLTASMGAVYAEPVNNLYALTISKDKRIAIVNGHPEETPYHAAGGLLPVLRDGENIGEHLDPDPLTLVGFNEEQTELYLMVIDGRQDGRAEGASPYEAGELLIKLGAFNAINMDGGSSSTMAMQNTIGGATVVSSPSKRILFTSIERPIATHLGIYAIPLAR